MLIAHLPSGYVLGRLMPRQGAAVMGAALIGAMLPDLDMIWFHFVDAGKWHHHVYWPHLPWVWAVAALVAFHFLPGEGIWCRVWPSLRQSSYIWRWTRSREVSPGPRLSIPLCMLLSPYQHATVTGSFRSYFTGPSFLRLRSGFGRQHCS
jgi:hypothetical protein